MGGWVKEYLHVLQECQKWYGETLLLETLFSDNSTPKNSWPPGSITETMADSKEFVHCVHVRAQMNELEKSIKKI